MRPTDFVDNNPKFSIVNYFSTPRLGQGIFFDRFGNVRTTFTAKLNGRLEGSTLILDEVLTYGNGESLNRTYVIKPLSQGLFSVECPDLVEPGTIEQVGNVLRWKYRLKQEIDGSVWRLKFDDWMFLQPDGETVINRAKAMKFGVEIGEVIMSVR
jgi:hypothetical protein